jgi:hypothetical protein
MKAKFTKLHSRIIQSSIMAESAETFKVWIALLAMCDWEGMADAPAQFLSQVCYLPIETVEKALAILEAPDPKSRSQIEGGRRIKKVGPDYFVMNYAAYRDPGPAQTPGAVRTRKWREKKEPSRGAGGGHTASHVVTQAKRCDAFPRENVTSHSKSNSYRGGIVSSSSPNVGLRDGRDGKVISPARDPWDDDADKFLTECAREDAERARLIVKQKAGGETP